jgi:signal transduction histidine kinase
MNQKTHLASVLIVDDAIDTLRLLSDLLSEQGYEVRAFANGRQALQAVESDPPDLVLLDISLPEFDGYEVCRRLRASERAKDVPVIFLTASTETADKVRAFEAGGVDYVTKPFQVEELLARVRTHVKLRRTQEELAENYTRLRALERLRDDVVHMVIHDLRSPLTALLIELRIVLRKPADALSADIRAGLRSALESAEAIKIMANDVLDVSRLEERRMPIEWAVWDLNQITREVCSVLRTTDSGRAVDIDSAGAVEVTCDGALVRRVIENLVRNAIRYSPADSLVRISITFSDSRVRVAVCDQGPDVPPEARETIFEKFGTLEAKQRTYRSVGLGLAFCKLAIQAHGGTVGVDSGVPTGSTFWFELPA